MIHRSVLTLLFLACLSLSAHAQWLGTRTIGVRTNLLFDAAAVPNVGVEWGMGGRWSMLTNGMFIWLSNSDRHRYWRIAAADVEVRRWLSSNFMKVNREGFHVGPYVAVYRYDIEFGGTGQRSDFNWGTGAAFGYTAPISTRLTLDFTLSVGYIDGKYKKYRPEDKYYMWEADYRRRYFGPTKAEVALVWNIELSKKRFWR